MIKGFLHIDVSKCETEEDLIKIKFQNENTLQVSFSKFFNLSKYIQDKYKYSEALLSIQGEIEKFKNEFNMREESIKLFIELIQEEKVDIPLEHYKDIYTLSEYFCIAKITRELDNMREKELYKDLSFTLQLLIDSENANNYFETELTVKIENFLRGRINDCLKNAKFGELGISTLFRIVCKSQKSINSNSIFEFIFESAETRFILIKFVNFNELEEDKIDEIIKFIEKQEENSREIYLEYISLNLSFIKLLKNKYNQVLNDLNQKKEDLKQVKLTLEQTEKTFKKEKMTHKQTKEELEQEKMTHNQTKEELEQEKITHKQTKEELEQEKMIHKQTKEELEQEKMIHNQTKEELEQEKMMLNQTKEELEQEKMTLYKTKEEFKILQQTNDEQNQENKRLKALMKEYEEEMKKSEKMFEELKNSTIQREKNSTKQGSISQLINRNTHAQDILVAGCDDYNVLGEKPNNKSKYHSNPVISPPVKPPLDLSSLLSYSIYYEHSVLITRDGQLKGIGNNKDGRITSSLPKTAIDHFTQFCIKDSSGRNLDPVSAVCYSCGTLYMFSKINDKRRQLVLCDQDINGGDPVFLEIGNRQPLALFGGYSHSCAISSEGEVIFINRDSIKESPESPIAAVSLPDGEKASSVACCEGSIVVLSSKGRVFESPVFKGSGSLRFSEVAELKGKEIVCVSGTYRHCLSVSKEGQVFGRGSNNNGKLGFGKGKNWVSSFTEISLLEGYSIKTAFAGYGHSLFMTHEGKILSCGYNDYGELLLSSEPGENVYSITETMITGNASFCVAGTFLSTVFIGDSQPPNTPNTRVQQYE